MLSSQITALKEQIQLEKARASEEKENLVRWLSFIWENRYKFSYWCSSLFCPFNLRAISQKIHHSKKSE